MQHFNQFMRIKRCGLRTVKAYIALKRTRLEALGKSDPRSVHNEDLTRCINKYDVEKGHLHFYENQALIYHHNLK